MAETVTRPRLDEQTERSFLRALAQQVHGKHGTRLVHLFNDVGVQKYLDFAELIRRHDPDEPILDWGCGFGHMTYLLRRLEFDVVSFDLHKRNRVGWRALFEHMSVEPVFSRDPINLPFDDAQFGALISCGVLEHVADEQASLAEIHRVLKPRGLFFVFMLPNLTSYVENINTIRGQSHHPIKYTTRGARRRLEAAGFEVLKHEYGNIVPKNLDGLPQFLHKVYDRWSRPIIAFDRLVSRTPLLNLIAGVHTFVARRAER